MRATHHVHAIFIFSLTFDQDVAAALRARPVLSQHGLPQKLSSEKNHITAYSEPTEVDSN